jgi:NAD(P)-dependent dehydrogenase (short-subunit alcohol dehydrogenase family)
MRDHHRFDPELGQAMAARLAADGCNIVLSSLGDAGEIGQASKIETVGVRALYHSADIAIPTRSPTWSGGNAASGAVDI